MRITDDRHCRSYAYFIALRNPDMGFLMLLLSRPLLTPFRHRTQGNMPFSSQSFLRDRSKIFSHKLSKAGTRWARATKVFNRRHGLIFVNSHASHGLLAPTVLAQPISPL